MLHGDSSDLTRRDFLRVSGAAGLTLADLPLLRAAANSEVNCIFLFLVGGPSQLDTWDLKPNAPSTVRGPFRPIKTNVPGIDICEHFPLMARMADRYAIVRSVHHEAAPVHETGQQLMQTGRLSHGGQEYPHYGAVVSHLRGRRTGMLPFVVLPTPIDHTGLDVSHGQSAGYLGASQGPFVLRVTSELVAEPDDRYGRNPPGQSCWLARRLVEEGARFVTVNMFDTVFNKVTWDCHADAGALATNLNDYQETLCPMFDRAYSALLDDLHQAAACSIPPWW